MANHVARVSLLLATVLCGFPVSAQEPAPLDRFDITVARYMALHRKVERYLPPVINWTDSQEAERSMTEMAAALRRVRWSAAEGEIFQSEISMAFRQFFATISSECQERLVDAAASAIGSRETVNDSFTWATSRSVPPCLQERLPQLPIELHYRIVGSDLMLVDLHANLVVDVLRRAVVDTTVTK